MFEESNEKFGALSGFTQNEDYKKLKKTFIFNYEDNLQKLKKDPTKDPEEKRIQRARIESEISRFSSLESSINFLVSELTNSLK